MMQFFNSAHAWPYDTYYVQETDTAPTIDGKISVDEWQTKENAFTDTISDLAYSWGSLTQISIEVVILRDKVSVFFLVKILTDIPDGTGNISIGIALANEKIQTMEDSLDRKVVFWSNTNESITYSYDLFNCHQTSSCTTTQSILPGLRDSNDVIAAFGIEENIRFFEIVFPLIPIDNVKDIEVGENTNFIIIVNPYVNLADEINGHGGKGSGNLAIKLSPQNRNDSLPFDQFFALIALSCSLLAFTKIRRIKK